MKVIDYWCEIFHARRGRLGPRLHQQHWSSFRELWQSIAFEVRQQHALA